MNWEAVGAVGEILGAVGVIVTLGYLAAQIRANTRQSRAAMTQSIVDGVNGVHNAVMVNPQLADVYVRAGNQEDLTESERMQWVSATNRAFNIYSAVQRAYDHGQVDQSFYEMYCQDVARASVQFGWAEEMRELLSNFPEEAKMQIFARLYR
jgi:uncharacterized protein YbcV (DUF1398 family)